MAARNSNKYDRQLRIWGDEGQLALENANICLLNCGPTGAEALKNLVLGGIGSCTIVDDSKVEARDLGNNFFVNWESIGLSKARTVSNFLQELNDTVEVKFIEDSAEALLNRNPEFFSQFTLIIATQMQEHSLLELDVFCRKQNVILLIARSYGLMGLVRVCVKEHCIIESKPENVINDLRLQKPWAELKRCKPILTLLEMDRILRPQGWVIFRERTTTIDQIRPALDSLRWDERLSYIQEGEQLLVLQKGFWRPDGLDGETT